MAQDEKKLIIGSRESLLAVRQSELVLDYLREHFPQMQIELVTMKTTGDKILHKRLDEIFLSRNWTRHCGKAGQIFLSTA